MNTLRYFSVILCALNSILSSISSVLRLIFFRYSRKQRLNETQRIIHQKTINNYKTQHKLKKVETSISKENSKTCNYEKFMEYLIQQGLKLDISDLNYQMTPYMKKHIYNYYLHYLNQMVD